MLWGGVLGIVTYLLYRNVALGGVMALAMLLNLMVAALAGMFIPLAMERFGRDPAVGSSVFLTFVTDSMGFFIFLGPGDRLPAVAAMARLFFALWPDEAAAAKLAGLAGELAARSNGKAVPAGKIHLTLAFLGNVAEDRVADLLAVRVDAASFTMRLDCTGVFPKAGVAWAGVESAPRELLDLQSKLMRKLARLGFSLDERAYLPARDPCSQVPRHGGPGRHRGDRMAGARGDAGALRYGNGALHPDYPGGT